MNSIPKILITLSLALYHATVLKFFSAYTLERAQGLAQHCILTSGNTLQRTSKATKKKVVNSHNVCMCPSYTMTGLCIKAFGKASNNLSNPILVAINHFLLTCDTEVCINEHGRSSSVAHLR